LGYKAVKVLKILELSRATYYYNISNQNKEIKHNGGRPIPGYSYNKDGKKICDEQIKEFIFEIIETEGAFYGYYKITKVLRRKYQLIINKKKIYRLCKELGVLRPQRIIRPKGLKKIAVNREITGPNTLWEVDIKYGYIHSEDRFFYILSYIDVYDRVIVDSHIGLSCTAADAVITLKRALLRRKVYGNEKKLVIRSDNGPQFKSVLFEDNCIKLGVEHERIPCKTPNKNAHIEAYHRILEDECLANYEFNTFAEAYETVSEFIKFYNNTRIHGSIDYLTPNEYHNLVKSGKAKQQIIKI